MLAGGWFIEIVVTCYLLLMYQSVQNIYGGTFCYKIVRLT